MRILIACEQSGRVREAFKAKRHDVWSCDLLPSEIPGQHIQDDVLKHLNENWDMMIAHPTCRYLANSGVRWLHTQPGRWEKMKEAAQFFKTLWLCDIPKICIENPIMHCYGKQEAGIAYCYDTDEYKQIIHPWMFGNYGENESKATCLWLKNLPKLVPENPLPAPHNQSIWRMVPSPTREREREVGHSEE